MRKKIMSLMLAVVMLLSLAVPVFGAEAASAVDVLFDDIISNYEPEDVVTQDVLDDIATAMAGELMTYAEDDAAEESKPVNMEDGVIWFLRNISGMEDRQLSTAKFGTAQFAYDCVELLRSMDILPAGYKPDADFTYAQLSTLMTAGAPLVNAMHAETKSPLFMNGMAQPIFPYTSGIPAEGETYDNADSDIIRFFVYVETNYDTDADGNLDLVKALVQLPRAAMEGDYQAATIYEARPYITGTSAPNLTGNGSTDQGVLASLYAQPAARTPSTETPVSTAEHAAKADSTEWYYTAGKETCYEDLEWYDYYLVRGFAVVECGGLGTKDSEGIETCGTDLEIDAFKCVIEWLHGDRIAYTDKTSNIPIEAEWSNKKVGMTGRSYAGTTQFGLANTGVAGLETIVPVAGIASWYEYSHSQGSVMTSVNYTNRLASSCSGRYYDGSYGEKNDSEFANYYANYLAEIDAMQRRLNGDYSNDTETDNHWKVRDYTNGNLLDWTGIKIPALIVHGLNDDNVKTKQFDLMYKTFDKAGQTAKLLLHWNYHVTPTYPAHHEEIAIGDQYYDSLLNKWFSHYLYGQNNGIENMANVTVQDNVNGSWKTYDSWKTASKETLRCADVAGEATVATAGGEGSWNRGENGWEYVYTKQPVKATYTFDVPTDITITGPVAVHVKAKANTIDDADFSKLDNIQIIASLTDKSETPFDAWLVDRTGYLPFDVVRENGAWMGGGVSNYDLVEYTMTETSEKLIGEGYIDVFNPEAGYEGHTAARRATQISEDTYYEYTVYIQPTFYTVAAGHTLELSIGMADGVKDLSVTVEKDSTYMELPTNTSGATATLANRVPTTVATVDSEPEEPTPTPPTSGGSSGGTVTKPVETSPVDKFIDVNTGDWFADAVNYVVNKGLMAGVSETTFGPSIDTTRGMIVTILYRLENEPTAGTANFNDVASGQYYANAVAWASANNIVSGYGDGNFGPNDAITREQLVAILFRYAEYKGYDLTKRADLSAFADETSISEYAVDAMSWANAMGLVSGVSDTMIAPTNRAVRAQVAMIFMSFCEKIVK